MPAIGVLASDPVPGGCLPALLASHAPEWVAGLYAAMLRDTLDGLLSIPADRYVVFAPKDDHALLARHVHAPWEIRTAADATAALEELGTSALLARSDAPTAPVDPLLTALAAPCAIGPTAAGEIWALVRNGIALGAVPWEGADAAAAVRARAVALGVEPVELPTCLAVSEPSAVVGLYEELRLHPERAPRTAHFVLTRG